VFKHLLRQPLAFFTRSQTGSLVSGLSTDVNDAQQAVTSLLAQSVSAVLTMIVIVMFYLSWQITVASVLIVPLFLLPARMIGKRL
jgi:ATP-binding cassette subfamily B protein